MTANESTQRSTRNPQLKDPDQYVGRFVWSRRRGKARILQHLGGRIFLYITVKTDQQFTGGLGTTVKLLKQKN